jgi:hypothetical protein
LEVLRLGAELGPMPVTVSAAANDRYWEGAGLDSPARRAGVLYPPLAANLTILLVQRHVTQPLLHTAQRLVCHARGDAPADLVVQGRLLRRYEKRGRDYAVVEAEVTMSDGAALWTSTATFTPVRP